MYKPQWLFFYFILSKLNDKYIYSWFIYGCLRKYFFLNLVLFTSASVSEWLKRRVRCTHGAMSKNRNEYLLIIYFSPKAVVIMFVLCDIVGHRNK